MDRWTSLSQCITDKVLGYAVGAWECKPERGIKRELLFNKVDAVKAEVKTVKSEVGEGERVASLKAIYELMSFDGLVRLLCEKNETINKLSSSCEGLRRNVKYFKRLWQVSASKWKSVRGQHRRNK